MGKKQKSQKTNNKNVLESEGSSESGDREIPEVMIKRHRREKDKGILSRGQRKRLFKKAKFYGREELIKRLEESNLQNKVNTSKTIIKQKIKKQNEDKFFFNKVDNELMNLIEEVGKENNLNLSEAKSDNKLETKQVNGKDTKKVNKENNKNKDIKDKKKQKPVVSVSNQAKNLIKENTFKSNKNKRYKVNKLIEDEKEKISSVLNNQVFQNNPIESVKNHIYQTQLINERNLQSNKNFMNHMKNINSMKQNQ